MTKHINITPSSDQDVLNAIFNAHEKTLGSTMFSIILCGSAATGDLNPTSDIDYIVVVDDISYENLVDLAGIRSELEESLGHPMSNTIIDIKQLYAGDQSILALDGKALQSLIESIENPSRIRSNTEFLMPNIDSGVVSDFSKQNFFLLKTLIIKHIVRNCPTDFKDYAYVNKLAKLCLIALKMESQALTSKSAMPIGPRKWLNTSSRRRLQQIRQDMETLTGLKQREKLNNIDEIIRIANSICETRPQDLRQNFSELRAMRAHRASENSKSQRLFAGRR